MKIYKLACVSTFIILLSGCNTLTSKTEESSLKLFSEVVNTEPVALDIPQNEKEEKSIGVFHPLVIDEEIASPIGESKSYFINNWSVPVKVSLSNTGTESFLYKIRNIDKGKNVINGVLRSNENFEQVFDRLPEGAYVISYLVQEEGFPMDIKLKVKVELLP